MHLPFPAADVRGRVRHGPVRLSIDGTANTACPHDLRLQQYAKDLGDDMRAALPHRIGSAELPWRGAWLDQWSLDVVCASVAESVDVDAEDWTGYRDRVEVRREAVRAQAAEELGREPLWLCARHVVWQEIADRWALGPQLDALSSRVDVLQADTR